MDTKKVLFFLDILRNNTTGYGEELANLYRKALDENDKVCQLKKLLDESNYYGVIGENLYNEAENKIQEIYANPGHALEILPELVQCSEKIESQVRFSQQILLNPNETLDTVSIVKKKDVIAYLEAYKMIASACVYLTVLYEGTEKIKYISWNDVVEIRDIIYLINTKFIPLLCSIKPSNHSWVIWKRGLGGKALFGGDAFYISYENTERMEVLCSPIRKEPMGTHSFLNIDAYEKNEKDVPFCWGTGNIVSFSPDEALLYLQKDIATNVKSPTSINYQGQMPTPMECLRRLSDGMPFCISPEDFIKVLNKWLIGKEIEDRKRTHNCLFCNRHLNGNKLVCDSHFDTEF